MQPAVRKYGHYLPLRKLGQGGMGTVFAARDERDPSRVVALKVISSSMGSGVEGAEETTRRFQREAKILEKLRHPNIVTFYEVGVADQTPYLAMELLDGVPLTRYYGKPWAESLPLLEQVCLGMDYLASRSIVHRDLSPDNVFVVSAPGGPQAKILDFGIAKDTTGDETLHNFTVTGVLVGKPQYWSPEQIGNLQEGERLDYRSDIYALGVIFYRVLSGTLPLKADDPISYISLHLMERPGPLQAPPDCPEIPPAVAAVVLKMLEKDRARRPQTYLEIIRVFREALGETGDEPPTFLGTVQSPLESPSSVSHARPQTRITEAWEEPTLRKDFAFQDTAELSDMKRTVQIHEEAPTIQARLTREVPASTGATVALPDTGGAGGATELLPGDRPSRAPRLLAAAAVVALGSAGAWLLLRPTERVEVPVTAATPTALPVAVAHGFVSIHAVPWLSLASVRSESGVSIPLPAGASTPLVLELPPGKYTLDLGPGGSVSVDVRAGQTSPVNVVTDPPEKAVSLLD